jgi:sulfite reductase alpha subunit-like flavoprotein
MTAPEWDQDVRLVEISTQEGLIYSPGSILQVIPSNTKEVVERFRELQPHLPPLETMLSFQPSSDHPAYAYSHAHSTSSDDPSSSFPSPLDALSHPFPSP